MTTAASESSDPLCAPIARGGEQIYCSIHRERSGIDSGIICPSCRVFAVDQLSASDQQDLLVSALLLVEMVLDHTDPENHRGRHILDRIAKRFGKASLVEESC